MNYISLFEIYKTYYNKANAILGAEYLSGIQETNFVESLFKNKKECKNRILQLLKLREKEGLIPEKLLQNLKTKRVRHIMSIFLLGLYIYDNSRIKSDINKKIANLFKDVEILEDEESRFYFVWMLLCLFHDNGYVVEENSKNIEQSEKKINDLLKAFEDDYKIGSYIPNLYNILLIKKYSQYRIHRMEVVDHGIYGGLDFINRVNKLREESESNDNSRCYWGKSLEKVYYEVAWTIMCHNIFKIENDNKNAKCYKCFGLDNLITEERIINPSNHSLLFLFCLADSIEPLKNNKINVLNKISINVSIDKIQIESTVKKYINSIEKIGKWLTNAKSKNDNTIEISL